MRRHQSALSPDCWLFRSVAHDNGAGCAETLLVAVFAYIEPFHNPKRKHTSNSMLSPVDVETRQQKMKDTGV